jgi:molecular chaperone HtpG
MSEGFKEEKGHISIHTENILPIIKKWLYSDREIFIRELVSNAVDANTKLKHLSLSGEYTTDLEELFVEITVDKEKKTITVKDNGIGMSADEIKKYINQIAFSGAEEFLKTHQAKGDINEIIGHFGLGFYSAFMVSDKVEILSKSYKDEPGSHWENDGGTEFILNSFDKSDRGTEVILNINEESKEFLEVTKVREILEKYCKFLPFPVKINGSQINENAPLWSKRANEVKDEEYKDFYKKLFPFEDDPLFWIHLDVEVPFRLKGILYFPKIKHELDSSKGRIKLYCNNVFVTDNSKEVIPDFLTLLQGTIDIADLPLNVSRSYLQNDPYVRKISEHITKKVADKLNELFKNDRSKYESFWDDISIFVKYGMMNNEKFNEKVKNIILFKTSDGVYKTLEEYKEKNKGINKEKDGKQVVLYSSDPEKQIALVDMVKKQGMEVIYFNSMIDVHFIQFIEMKESGISFIRLDSDSNELLEGEEESKIVDENNKSITDHMKSYFESVLNKDDKKKVEIKVKSMKDQTIPAMIVFSEHLRRFKEMNFIHNKDNDIDLFGDHTLVINSSNEVIKKIYNSKDDSSKQEVLENMVQNVYDLALLSQDNLKGERLVNFINRTNNMLDKVL